MALTVQPGTRSGLVQVLFSSVDQARVAALMGQVAPLLEARPAVADRAASVRAALGSGDTGQLMGVADDLRSDRAVHVALLSDAVSLARAAGFETEVDALTSPVFAAEPAFTDPRVEEAWERFLAGAAGLNDLSPSLVYPVGALSGGIIHYLDRQGLAAFSRFYRKDGRSVLPPVCLGVLSRETPERIDQYNAGEHGRRMGNVSLDFEPDLQMAVLPRRYGERLSRQIALQFVMPAAMIMEAVCDEAWARNLAPNAVVVTGVKGLPGGKTPLEHLVEVLKTTGRLREAETGDVFYIDVLGFLPSARMIRTVREAKRHQTPLAGSWDIVLASPYPTEARKLAYRWAGPDADERDYLYKGVPMTLIQSRSLTPRLRIFIVTDPEVIRANELASIYKNLEAIDLGKGLFDELLRVVDQGGPDLEAASVTQTDRIDFNRAREGFYLPLMRKAERDILKILEIEGVPRPKRVLLPAVREDLYGSWRTDSYVELYNLVRSIFRKDANHEEWVEAMILLKERILQFYSVRNPCYGFCLEADREAIRRGRSPRRQDIVEAIGRLKAKGLLSDDYPLPPDSSHYSFSMIPDGLIPEGHQIVEQLPVRHKGRFRDLPPTFRASHRHVERMQHPTYFDAAIQQQVVDLTREIAQVVPGSPSANWESFLRMAEAVHEQFRRAHQLLEQSRVDSVQLRVTRAFVGHLEKKISEILTHLRAHVSMTPVEVCLLGQSFLESLCRANLFYMLSRDENSREGRHLERRLDRIARFAQAGGSADDLFPGALDDPEVDPRSADEVRRVREALFQQIGPGLIGLTHDMSEKFHNEEAVISVATIKKAVTNMLLALRSSRDQVSEGVADDRFLFGMIAVLQEIFDDLGPGGRALGTRERLLAYQALVEALVHARRLITFPEERAPVEIRYTVKRFEKVRAYLRGQDESPLWHFGRRRATPAPATT